MLGFPVLRLRGDYLAIVTLAFGEIIRLVLINWVDFTNGDAGISASRAPTFFGLPSTAATTASRPSSGSSSPRSTGSIFLYYVILGLALAHRLRPMRLRRLPVGRAWEALREDEIACRSLGINTTNTKLTAFAIGAMFGGFAGSFFAARQGFISPGELQLPGIGDHPRHRRARRHGQPDRRRHRGGRADRRHRDPARARLPASRSSATDFDPNEYRMLLFGLGMVLIMVWRPRGLISAARADRVPQGAQGRSPARSSRRDTADGAGSTAIPILDVEHLTMRFGGLVADQRPLLPGRARRHHRADRPERRRQDHRLQLHHRLLQADRRHDHADASRERLAASCWSACRTSHQLARPRSPAPSRTSACSRA